MTGTTCTNNINLRATKCGTSVAVTKRAKTW